MSKKTTDIANYINGLGKTNASTKNVIKPSKKAIFIANNKAIIKGKLPQNEIVSRFRNINLNQKLVAKAIMSYMKNRTRGIDYDSIMVR